MAEARESRRLEENLAALSPRQPSLAGAVRAAAPDPRLVLLSARNGMLVPGVRSTAGTVPLHSLYDPGQEAARIAESHRGSGFLVVCGLGAGFHIAALLQNSGVRAVVVVEKNTAVLRSLLSQFPLASLLADSRVILAAGSGSIRESVLAVWQPAFMGGMRTVSLRPWCEQEQAFFDDAAHEVQAAIELVRADYGVQSHFGKHWLANILINIGRAEGPLPALPRSDTAAVTAAGPSLEMQLSRLASEREKLYLLATDTSLPALVRSGIRPDAVLSIDCQNHGYHHFLQGIPEGTALFLDLASPPLLGRYPVPTAFVASTHPFVRHLATRWKSLPVIDTSGGNVTHAAVSLVLALGARRVEVYGADFSYPSGKAYARGTYLYDHFWADQSRVSPAEARFFSFVHGSSRAQREVRAGRLLYTTPLLLGYRERFLELMSSTDAEIFPVPGTGLDLPRQEVKERTYAVTQRTSPLSRDIARVGDWRELLSEYARNVERLSDFSKDCSGAARELWETLLPVAARVVRDGVGPGPQAMEEARRWSLERIHRVLQPSDGPSRG